jgi:hypothetical protein
MFPGSLDELATTPRADENLELLSLALRPGLTADAALYERVVRDVGLIRALEPAVAHINYFFGRSDGRGVLLDTQPATNDEMASGSYHAWDCINAYFGLRGTRVYTGIDFAFVELKGIYGMDEVVPLYAALPGVLGVEPNGLAGDGPTICATEEGDTIHWVFVDASGDCFAGCYEHAYYYFTTTMGGDLVRHTDPGDWLALYGPAAGTTCRR